jgi:RimJ/RimL family protein N-acetyltransferase
VLRTPRLFLNPPAIADAAQILAILSDSRAVDHNPSDRLDTVEQVIEVVSRWRDHWVAHGYGYWCMRTGPGSEVIGYCGIKTVKFRGSEALNLMYRLAPAAWGHGLATEAASAVVAWAIESLPHPRIIARVRPGNIASQHVATKAGLRHAPDLDDRGEDGLDLVFALPHT